MSKKLFPMLSLLLIVGMTGCNGVKNSMRMSEKDSPWNPVKILAQERKDDQADDAKAVSMAAIWADSVYEKPGIPTIKGFGGRIFFYDANNTPIKAEGELIVYGFDHSIKKPEPQADKKFVFRQEDFQQHYSENDLGASYSVWLPWERVGGYRKSVTLVPMFRTTDGRLIKCSQSISNLPGRKPKEEEKEVAEKEHKQAYEVLGSSPAVVSQANYQSGTPLNVSNNMVGTTGHEITMQSGEAIKTSTIRMTPSMSRRMELNAQNRKRASNRQTGIQSPALQRSNTISTSVQNWPSESSQPETTVSESPAAETAVKSDGRTFGQPGAWN